MKHHTTHVQRISRSRSKREATYAPRRMCQERGLSQDAWPLYARIGKDTQYADVIQCKGVRCMWYKAARAVLAPPCSTCTLQNHVTGMSTLKMCTQRCHARPIHSFAPRQPVSAFASRAGSSAGGFTQPSAWIDDGNGLLWVCMHLLQAAAMSADAPSSEGLLSGLIAISPQDF
jgi:hypothetical protein